MRRNRNTWRLFLAPLLGIWLSTANAQTTAYQVELLVFSHLDARIAGGVPAKPFSMPSGTLELSDTHAGDDFRALDADAFTLSTAASILAGSAGYHVIEHVAWRQPGWSEDAARPVRIHGGDTYQRANAPALLPDATPNDAQSNIAYPYAERQMSISFEELDGTVKVALGRYLHVYTDLVYREQVSASHVAQPGTRPRQPASARYQYRVQNQRRMRSRELHYLDHPLVGVLVRITPVEEPVPPPALTPEDEREIAPDANPAMNGSAKMPSAEAED